MPFAALLNLADERVHWLTSAPGDSQALRKKKSRLLALAIRPVLESLVIDNQLYLKIHRVPLLYQSGVVYREEPPTIVRFEDGRRATVEEFASLPIVLARGWGDCDDLAPARCAELRNAGERAGIRIQWKQPTPDSQKIYHIVVRRTPFVRDFNPLYMARDRSGCVIEDPSKALGMPSTIRGMREAALYT